MEAYEYRIDMKFYPDDRYSPVSVSTGILREVKLPGETDLDLINRTHSKAQQIFIIGAEVAIRLKRDVLMTSLGVEELEVLSKNAVEILEQIQQKETETLEQSKLTKV